MESGRDNSTEHCTMVGRASEHLVRRHFESLGFTVAMANVKGPDLTISKGRYHRTVEVKTVCKTSPRRFFVAKVQPARERDSLIAYVYGKRVVVRPMKEHLRFRDRCGQVTVTDFFLDPHDRLDDRKSRTPKSGYRGVVPCKGGKFLAYIKGGSSQQRLGRFSTAVLAAKAYNKAAQKIYGRFAILNAIS